MEDLQNIAISLGIEENANVEVEGNENVYIKATRNECDIINSEKEILECMADLFCGISGEEPKIGLAQFAANFNVYSEGTVDVELLGKQVDFIKEILCSYACKEFAIADIINSLVDKEIVEKGLINVNNNSCCRCKGGIV